MSDYDTQFEKQSAKQIKIGAMISYLAIAVNIISGILYTPWMLNQIGRSNYSLYTLATSLIAMFTIDFGMSAAVSRFVSKYNAEKDQQSINNFLGIVYKLYFFIAAAISLVLVIVFFLLGTIYAKLSPAELESFKIVYIIASLSTIISFPFITLNGVLTSYEKFVELKTADILNRLFTISFTILALMLNMGLYALVTVSAIGNFVAIVIKLIIVKRQTPIKVKFKYKSKPLLLSIFSFSLWTTVSSIMGRLIFNITPTILSIVSTTAGIASFGLAKVIEGFTYTFSQAIDGMFLPKISRIVSKSDNGKEVLPLMIKVGRINLNVVALIILGFILFGKEFIDLWVGNEYLDVYYCSVLLILPCIIHLPQQIAQNTLIALNKVKLQSVAFIVMGIVNVILSFVLSRYLGAVGASLSICISYCIRTFLLNVMYHKFLKINIFIFFKECHLKMIIGLVASSIIGVLISKFLTISSGVIALGLKIVCFTLIYIIIMWLLAWNQYEKNLFGSIPKSIVSKIIYSIKRGESR